MPLTVLLPPRKDTMCPTKHEVVEDESSSLGGQQQQQQQQQRRIDCTTDSSSNDDGGGGTSADRTTTTNNATAKNNPSMSNYSAEASSGHDTSMQPQTPAQFPRADKTAIMDPSFSTGSEFSRDFAHLAATPFSGIGAQTPGGFGTVGQTPLTAASLGSSTGEPTPSYPPNPTTTTTTTTAAAEMGKHSAEQQLGAATGLIRGNDPLQPTPVVRRKEPERKRQQQLPTPSPGMHYHTTALQQSAKREASPHQLKQVIEQPKLGTVEEEDPSMLRYESRPGMDHSPMAGNVKRENLTSSSQDNNTSIPSDADNNGNPLSSPSNLEQDRTELDRPSEESTQQPPLNPSLREFPFYYDGYGAWICRHCLHIPPYYRGSNYVWQFTHAPPNHYVDHHLRFCQGLNPDPSQPQPPVPSTSYPMQYPGMPPQPPPPASSGGYPYPMQQPPPVPPHHMQHPPPPQSSTPRRGGPRQSMNMAGEERAAPDPPGLTSPTPKHKKGGDEGIVKGGPSERPPTQPAGYPYYPGNPYHPPPPYPYHHYPPQSTLPPPHMMPPPNQPAILHSPGQSKLRGTMMSPPAKKKATIKASPRGRQSDDGTYAKAIEFLKKKSDTRPKPDPMESDIGSTLIDDSDGDLLTDYFFYMMKQLVVCRFSEKDRKTRGGKRESINIGYGGLQCLHCFDNPGSRKFFWSNVDRLANSFAEIPGHVLKCKLCPDNMKDALLVLKGRHPDQMQLLPRGSQKVFFRRMWRRLHDGDDDGGAMATPSKEGPATVQEGDADSSAVAIDASLKSPIVASNTAARILAQSLDAETNSTEPPTQLERVLLAIPQDKEWLSDMDCFVRQNIEVFSATTKDVAVAEVDRKYPIKPAQVGIRCIHCASTPGGACGTGVSYPYSISGIYESVREFQRLHLEHCDKLPQDMRDASLKLDGATSLSSVLRRYYVQAARALGLFDTSNGINAGATPVPMSSAGFQSPTSSFRKLSTIADSAVKSARDPNELSSLTDTSRKRKMSDSEPDGKPESKRHDSKEETSDDVTGISKVTGV